MFSFIGLWRFWTPPPPPPRFWSYFHEWWFHGLNYFNMGNAFKRTVTWNLVICNVQNGFELVLSTFKLQFYFKTLHTIFDWEHPRLPYYEIKIANSFMKYCCYWNDLTMQIFFFFLLICSNLIKKMIAIMPNPSLIYYYFFSTRSRSNFTQIQATMGRKSNYNCFCQCKK